MFFAVISIHDSNLSFVVDMGEAKNGALYMNSLDERTLYTHKSDLLCRYTFIVTVF